MSGEREVQRGQEDPKRLLRNHLAGHRQATDPGSVSQGMPGFVGLAS